MGSGKKIPAKERRPLAYAMWCQGDSQADIADHFGVSPQQISKDVNSHAATLPDVIGANARIRRIFIEIDEAAAAVMEAIRTKDGTLARLVSALIQLHDRQSKLLGLDAPRYRAIESEQEGLDPININEQEIEANAARHGAVNPAEWSKEVDDGDTEREDGSAEGTA